MGGCGEAWAGASGQIHRAWSGPWRQPWPQPQPDHARSCPTTPDHARPRQAAWAKNVPYDEEALCRQKQRELLAAGAPTASASTSASASASASPYQASGARTRARHANAPRAVSSSRVYRSPAFRACERGGGKTSHSLQRARRPLRHAIGASAADGPFFYMLLVCCIGASRLVRVATWCPAARTCDEVRVTSDHARDKRGQVLWICRY